MTEQKRELILKALAKFNSVWPSIYCDMIASYKGEILTAKSDGLGSVEIFGAFGLRIDIADLSHVFCTRSEFEAVLAELFDGAPDWVEYYYKDRDLWVDIGEIIVSPRNNVQGITITAPIMSQNLIPRHPKREQEQPWNGEGLPPVGEKVLYTTTEHQEGKPSIEVGKWYLGTIIAYHNGFVWTSDNGLRMLRVTKFRPLKTEAEKERGRLYEDAKLECEKAKCFGPTYSFLDCIETLIDAGWRPSKN